jgi:hypothetical protein
MMLRISIPILALLAVGGAAGAAELPKSGKLDFRFFSHNVQTIAELDTSDGMKSYVNEAYEFHVGKDKSSPVDNTVGRCLGYGSYHPEKGAVHEVGKCTFQDADGDKIFESYEVKLTDSSDRSPARATLDGGTGKFEGISGSLTSTVEVLPALGPGQTMWAGHATGEYKIGQ